MRTNAEKISKPNSISLEEAVSKGRDTVADALAYLTSNQVQNFYARVINLMDRYSIPGMGTMGVTVQHGRYVFIYDPVFAATVSYDEVRATCEHEVLHLILEHIPRSMQLRTLYVNDEDRALFDMTNNLAVDLAVNEFLARSWPGVKDPAKPLGHWVVPDLWTPPLPTDMAYDDYHRLLLDLLKNDVDAQDLQRRAENICKNIREAVKKALGGEKGQGQGQGEGQGEGQGQGQGEGQGEGQGQGQGQGSENPLPPDQDLDPGKQKMLEALVKSMLSHMGWDAGTQDPAEAHKAADHGKELIKHALQDTKSRGTLPGHMVELIQQFLTPPAVPWTQFLHNIVQRTRQTKRVRGMARPSKKLAALKVYARKKIEEGDTRFLRYAKLQQMPVFPGVRQDNKFTIVYAIDTSGSMSTKDCALGLSEIQHIQKADSEIDICILYADTTINKEYWVDSTAEVDPELMGRGGTDFEPVFEYVAQMTRSQDKAPDLLIYCTDGYAPPPTTRLPIPTVWLLTPRGMPVMAESGHITIMMKDYFLQDADV